MNDELTSAIISNREKLEKRIGDIGRITEINELMLLVVQKNLAAIKKDLEQIGKGGGTAKIIDHSLQLLENTTKSPEVLALKKIIREQIIVLYMGSSETFLSDTIKSVGNIKPEYFRFKTENENITFNQSMLKSNFTLGDALLEHIENKNYSFQDLKSTLNVFTNYLDIQLDVEDIKDSLIFMAATRHIIVHNSSVVDKKFLKQIRETSWAELYSEGDNIDVDQAMLDGMLIAVQQFADLVVAAMIERDEE
ncbi:MAG: hypothetical protein WAW62_01150 [Candidatus Saccharimonas aalborgensis]